MEKHRRKFFGQLAGITGLAAAPLSAYAGAIKVNDVRLSHKNGYSRLVFDLNAPVSHKLFSLHNPERVVIDLKNTRLMNMTALEDLHNKQLQGIRTGVHNINDLRVVLDLSSNAKPRSFLLKPSGENGHRLVIDLHQASEKTRVAAHKPKKLRNVMVAIDPGHGGKDPGASGRLGTKEKDVTLQIARKLQKIISKQPGMSAELIRSSDRFMHLRERIKRAHQLKADLMISVHADAFPDKRARGASVYALSVGGATSESARLLAEKENKVEKLFGNVSLDDKDEVVKQVLLDLSLTGTIQSSLDIGAEVLHELKKVGRVHKKRVQQAGFAVLKAPNIPAILLETAFISNPKEERKLRSPAHQAKMAKAILRGVGDYFARKAPPGTWLSQTNKSYVIKRGDTLAEISEKFKTPVSHIRSRNALHNDRLKVGQRLYIPLS